MTFLNTGLILFKLTFNSLKYIRIHYELIHYNIQVICLTENHNFIKKIQPFKVVVGRIFCLFSPLFSKLYSKLSVAKHEKIFVGLIRSLESGFV